MIYDFGGFPRALFEVQYPARGSVQVATEVASRLKTDGIDYVLDTERGIDHGTWVVLSRMFPEATIPVVQVSIHPFLPPAQQVAIGTALRGMDADDILIIGSGATVHNFGYLNPAAKQPDAWAVEFDDWLVAKIQAQDLESLYRYEELAPYGKRAVPRPDHFVPIFIAMGSGNPERGAEVIHRSYEYGSLSYIAMRF